MDAKTKRCWRAVVDLANAGAADDATLLKSVNRFLKTFELVPQRRTRGNQREHSVFLAWNNPALIKVGRENIPLLRSILKWMSRAKGAADASSVIVEHSHASSSPGVIEVLRKGEHAYTKREITKDVVIDGRKWRLREELLIPQSPFNDAVKRGLTSHFKHFIDPICGFIKPVCQKRGNELAPPILPPVAICAAPSCDRFFIRRTRGRYHSPSCKNAVNDRLKRPEKKKQSNYVSCFRRIVKNHGRDELKRGIEKMKRRRPPARERIAIAERVLAESR